MTLPILLLPQVSKISDKVKASLSNGSPRPSSTGPAVSRSRPPTTTPIPSRPSSTGPHSSSSPPPTQGVISHCLPDPYDELDVEAQAVVNSVAEMGFPRDRVSRAVMKLGTKHKKVGVIGYLFSPTLKNLLAQWLLHLRTKGVKSLYQ